MPTTHTFVLFSLAALALLVVPGPAVMYILTRSIDQGRGAGVASVLGVHTGSLVHIAAAGSASPRSWRPRRRCSPSSRSSEPPT